VLSRLLRVGRAEALHFADGLLHSGFGFGLHGLGLFRNGWLRLKTGLKQGDLPAAAAAAATAAAVVLGGLL
jgi:hypothetical protein